jgi:antitoxin component YwqK of YwqJK toxin-antitoxin module
MKYYILILIGIVLYSCKEESNKSLATGKKTIIPQFVISNLSKDLAIQNDTLYFRNKKFEGVLYGLYNNSTDTMSVEYFANGILNGVSKKWFPNTLLMEKRYYTQGQKNGKQTAYFENGIKKFDFTAKNDQYEGVLKEWNSDGKLIHLATFKNGQEEGTQKMWYNNGKIRANYVMLNGKRYGLLGTKNCKNVSDSIFIVR